MEKVRQEKTQEDFALQEAAEKKKRELEKKVQKHQEIVARGNNRDQRRQEVFEKNHAMGDEGRQLREHADSVVQQRSEYITKMNQEQAVYVRESTRQNVGASRDMVKQKVAAGAQELKQAALVNAEKAVKVKEAQKIEKTKKKDAVLATRGGARAAAAKMKARNDQMGIMERERTAQEEEAVRSYHERVAQYKQACHDEVKAQANFTKDRAMQIDAERKRQAEADRADVVQKLQAQAQKKEMRLAAVAQKTAALKEDLHTKASNAKQKLAADKKAAVQRHVEERDAQSHNFTQAASNSLQQIQNEEQYLLEQLAALQ